MLLEMTRIIVDPHMRDMDMHSGHKKNSRNVASHMHGSECRVLMEFWQNF